MLLAIVSKIKSTLANPTMVAKNLKTPKLNFSVSVYFVLCLKTKNTLTCKCSK